MSDTLHVYQRAIAKIRDARANLLPLAGRVQKAAAYLSAWEKISETAAAVPPSFMTRDLGEALVQWPTQNELAAAMRAWEQALDELHRLYNRLSEEERQLLPPPENVSM
jgi:hypothetical protein